MQNNDVELSDETYEVLRNVWSEQVEIVEAVREFAGYVRDERIAAALSQHAEMLGRVETSLRQLARSLGVGSGPIQASVSFGCRYMWVQRDAPGMSPEAAIQAMTARLYAVEAYQIGSLKVLLSWTRGASHRTATECLAKLIRDYEILSDALLEALSVHSDTVKTQLELTMPRPVIMEVIRL